MEKQNAQKKEPGIGQGTSSGFEVKLKTAILARLEMLSLAGKEKVLDYINTLIDSEEKLTEFHRRQGKLYHFAEEEEREEQV